MGFFSKKGKGFEYANLSGFELSRRREWPLDRPVAIFLLAAVAVGGAYYYWTHYHKDEGNDSEVPAPVNITAPAPAP